MRRFDKKASPILSQAELEKRGLVWSGRYLPYNPDLVTRAKELRNHMTDPEKKLWFNYLRVNKFRFLRQRPIDHFIADFYCAELKLIIEVDGETHFTEEGKGYDKERSMLLESYGLTVLRFSNIDIMDNFKGVCEKIEEFVRTLRSCSLNPERKNPPLPLLIKEAK